MAKWKVLELWMAIAALALATSCIGSADSATDENVAADENVASTAEALGGFTVLADVGNETVLDLGPTYTVFRNQPPGSCGSVDIRQTQTGAQVTVPALPGCADITAASSQLFSDVYVADHASGQIYRLLNGSWVSVKATTTRVTRMFTDRFGGLLWWYDESNLHRLDLFTMHDSFFALPNATLLAADPGPNAGVIYANDQFASPRRLLRIDYGLPSPSVDVIATSTAILFAVAGIGFDDTYVYGASKSGSGNTAQIWRVPKTPPMGTMEIVESSTTSEYFSPRSTGSMRYLISKANSDGSFSIKRRNLSNGNITTAAFPAGWPSWSDPKNLTRLGSDGIYFVQQFTSPTTHQVLYRTGL